MKAAGRNLSYALAFSLAAFAVQAVAATQGGTNFNHLSTGFPLSGGHAVAACETCHVGGIFKGTPRACDGCHATGKRIVATTKTNSHIVTDAPCENCHFNTATWSGARYNHSAARVGDCLSCHNGRISTGKPSNHIPTTESCDRCHRTSTWTPASWNHTGAEYIGVDCLNCHNGSTARTYTNTAIHSSYIALGITTCRSCHNNFTRFSIYHYGHNDAGYLAQADCLGCHDGTKVGVRGFPNNHQFALQNLINLPVNCESCHSTTATWVGMNHSVIKPGTLCRECHEKGKQNFAGMRQKGVGHKKWNGSGDCTNSGCHSPTNFTSWGD